MHVVELIRNLKVKWGMVEEDWYARVMEPVVSYLRSFALVARSEYFTQHPKLLETWQDGMVMTVAVLRWLIFCLPSWDSILYLVVLDNKGPACRSSCSIAPMGGFPLFPLRKPIWPWRCSSSAGFWAWSYSWRSFLFSQSSWNLCSELPGVEYGIYLDWEGVS